MGIIAERKEEEALAVYNLGKSIGFGNMMSLAQEAWEGMLESEYGYDGGAFVVGPCKVSVVRCGCSSPKDCVWCCGCGWLTAHVKKIKDQRKTVKALERKIERLQEYYDASQAVEAGVLDFDLQHSAVERLRKATKALERKIAELEK